MSSLPYVTSSIQEVERAARLILKHYFWVEFSGYKPRILRDCPQRSLSGQPLYRIIEFQAMTLLGRNIIVRSKVDYQGDYPSWKVAWVKIHLERDYHSPHYFNFVNQQHCDDKPSYHAIQHQIATIRGLCFTTMAKIACAELIPLDILGRIADRMFIRRGKGGNHCSTVIFGGSPQNKLLPWNKPFTDDFSKLIRIVCTIEHSHDFRTRRVIKVKVVGVKLHVEHFAQIRGQWQRTSKPPRRPRREIRRRAQR